MEKEHGIWHYAGLAESGLGGGGSSQLIHFSAPQVPHRLNDDSFLPNRVVPLRK